MTAPPTRWTPERIKNVRALAADVALDEDMSDLEELMAIGLRVLDPSEADVERVALAIRGASTEDEKGAVADYRNDARAALAAIAGGGE